MGKTSHSKKWEETYAWLGPVNTDKFMAYWKIYLKSFWIDNSGLSEVKSDEKCHKPGQTLSNQRTFETGQKGQISLLKISFVFNSSRSSCQGRNFTSFAYGE